MKFKEFELAAAKYKQGEARADRYRRMGFEMAKRLAKAGCDITVWNRTVQRPSRSRRTREDRRFTPGTRALRHRVLHVSTYV